VENEWLKCFKGLPWPTFLFSVPSISPPFLLHPFALASPLSFSLSLSFFFIVTIVFAQIPSYTNPLPPFLGLVLNPAEKPLNQYTKYLPHRLKKK
jgi:hypothetical protein